jgi:hypothetical protein
VKKLSLHLKVQRTTFHAEGDQQTTLHRPSEGRSTEPKWEPFLTPKKVKDPGHFLSVVSGAEAAKVPVTKAEKRRKQARVIKPKKLQKSSEANQPNLEEF